jgi:hypothetical protein
VLAVQLMISYGMHKSYQGKAAIDWDLRDVLSTQAASAHSGKY